MKGNIIFLLLSSVLISSCSSKEAICYTPGCIRAAIKILNNIDRSVDPCDDFYQFSCGNFLKYTAIPNDKPTVNTFDLVRDPLHQRLREIFEEPLDFKGDTAVTTKVKLMYKGCMDTDQIEKIGLKGIKSVLKELGGWPVLDGENWNEDGFDWKRALAKLRALGFNEYLFELGIKTDMKNTTRKSITIDQASLTLAREYLIKGFEETYVQALYKLMVDVALIFGADKKKAQKELLDVLSFERQLAKISAPKEERRNGLLLYNAMTIEELQRNYPSLNWLEYINEFLAPHSKVTHDELVVVYAPKYMTNLGKLIKNTPKRVISNFLSWKTVKREIPFLTEKLRKRMLLYETVISGATEYPSRWLECVTKVNSGLGHAVGALYVKKYFSEDDRKTIQDLVNNIIQEFKINLIKLDWMDEKTKRYALEKVDAIGTHIGYPVELLDDAKLEDYYHDLNIDERDYMSSMMNLSQFYQKYSYKTLHESINKSDWINHGKVVVVNAFYSPSEHSIQLPAGILQGALFQSDRPNYMNYGGIGHIIGHEITHGFDDGGSQRDKDGNLAEWWEPETKEIFTKKAQCIIDQYSNYIVPEVNLRLNGIHSQGENIADNGGMKIAYQAYESWVKKNGEEPRLPVLQYSPQQMFWISAASIWCGVLRPEYSEKLIMNDKHCPPRYRVWGTVSNMPQFAKDFNCKPNQKMNPEKKCQLW